MRYPCRSGAEPYSAKDALASLDATVATLLVNLSEMEASAGGADLAAPGGLQRRGRTMSEPKPPPCLTLFIPVEREDSASVDALRGARSPPACGSRSMWGAGRPHTWSGPHGRQDAPPHVLSRTGDARCSAGEELLRDGDDAHEELRKAEDELAELLRGEDEAGETRGGEPCGGLLAAEESTPLDNVEHGQLPGGGVTPGEGVTPGGEVTPSDLSPSGLSTPGLRGRGRAAEDLSSLLKNQEG